MLIDGFLADLTRTWLAMRKKTASGVLASLSGSTYRSVRLATSLAAALLDSLFAHPAWLLSVVSSHDIGDGHRD